MREMNRAGRGARARFGHVRALGRGPRRGTASLVVLVLAGATLAGLAVLGVALGSRPASAQDPREGLLAPPAAGTAATRPSALRAVNPWGARKNAQQIDVPPAEARLFYRRGLIARQSGQDQEAVADVRGALELDPSFLEPHVTLASWSLFSDPAQTLLHSAAVLDMWRHDFNLQLDLAANALVLGLEAVFAGLLFAGLFVVVHRRHELSHALNEELTRIISTVTARWWVPVLLVLPFLAGIGLTLPVLFLLAFLWPMLRARERVLGVLLATAAGGAPLGPPPLVISPQAPPPASRPSSELRLPETAAGAPPRPGRVKPSPKPDPRDGSPS